MAGNYPDPPGLRMGYDADGSVVTLVSPADTISVVPSGEVATINDQALGGLLLASATKVAVLFPEARDLQAVFFSFEGYTGSVSVQTSQDSTNGLDGTWTSRGTQVSAASPVTSFRYPSTMNVPGVRAVRISQASGADQVLAALHLYGLISAGENPDRLELWHPTQDRPLYDAPGYLDFGNAPRGTTDRTKQFRIKNLSGTKTASGISVALEVPTEQAPSLASQYQFSFGGGAYAPSVTIGNLAPQSVSGPVTIQKATASLAVLGVHTARIVATPAVMA